MQRFDINGDGLISIEELGLGLKGIGVKISEKEKLALMKELDLDRDGSISKQELYIALSEPSKSSIYSNSNGFNIGSPVNGYNQQSSSGIDLILSKMRKCVDHYKSMQEQIICLMRIFDLDNDGLVSYLEFGTGLKNLGINARKSDTIDLFNRIDTDNDGFITQNELYKSLDLKP